MSGLPMVNVPPILIWVVEGAPTVAINKLPELEAPMRRVMEPPLLPVNETSGPFKIEIKVPGRAPTSNIAGENE